MAELKKIDSNIAGLRYCKEESIGVLPAAASQTWYPLEPNSFKDFGAKIKTVARNPINPGRQRKKGVTVGIDASGGFSMDLTQTNMQDILQGFFQADVREKATTKPMNGAQVVITSVTTGPNTYTAASGLTVFKIGDLVYASGFTNAANNGLKRVTAVAAGVLTVAETLVAEASPPAGAKLTCVGFQFGSAEMDITTPGGAFPTLSRVSGTKDLTEFGLIPGEWIFIGGDSAALKFVTAANNGFARVRSVSASVITLDKTASTLVAEVGTGLTIQVFFGRVLKNETGTSIKRRTYQLERKLGAHNDADLTKEQADYLTGAVPNELSLAIPTQEKVTADFSFVALDSTTIDENVTGANTLKSKVASVTAPSIEEADAFNTSSDVTRIRMSQVSSSNSNPTALFTYIQELTIDLKNNATPNAAIGVAGAFEVTSGTFEIGGKMTVYFADVAAIAAVRNNNDITLDGHFVKANAGISFDMPLLSLGGGLPNVEQDQPITLPLENSAATGAKVASTLNHTLLLVFWDYLPSLADT